MRKSFAVLFSYLFMLSASICLACALCLIVLVLRHYFDSSSERDREFINYLFVILAASVFLAPLSLYLSDRLGKLVGPREGA